MFDQYRKKIEEEMEKAIFQMGEKNKLRDACEYALQSGGKRLRPIFVLMISNALGFGLDLIPAALSVEFFHTASLIADDLPCMDNDEQRRNRPSLHCAFEESIALLASYTLIAAGYAGIHENGMRMKVDSRFAARAETATLLCLEIATRCAGIKGATGGQFLDLFPPNKKEETVRKIIAQKTVTLFQISFAFGWLFGGGDASCLKTVEETAYYLGMSFQIADDLQDEIQDTFHKNPINIVSILGRRSAYHLFDAGLSRFESGLKELKIWNEDFVQAVSYLQQLGMIQKSAI